MAGFDITAAGQVLKNVYLPPIQEALNNDTVLLSKIGKESRDLSGNSWIIPQHYGRNLSAGLGITNTGYTPDPGVQAYKQMTASPKFIYGSVRFWGTAIAATKSDQGSFVRAIKSEIDGLTKDIKKAVNRQMHGDGSDALAYFAAAPTGTSPLLDDGNAYVFTHLQAGVATPVQVVSSGSTATAFNTTRVVTLGAEGSTAFAATLDIAVSTAAIGDYLVPVTGTSATGTHTLGRQMMGIAGIISASDPVIPDGGGVKTGLHGLAVATYPWWSAQTIGSDSSKADLSFANMQKVLSKIGSNSDASESDVKFLLCSYQTRDKYLQLCTDERRIVNEMELDGGFRAVSYNGIPLVPDSQCKRGRIYFIVPSSLKIFRTEDFGWLDKNGNYLWPINGQDAYDATLAAYQDLVCLQRNVNGVLLGIYE